MSFKELIRDRSELEQLADLLQGEIKSTKENVISRYVRVVYDSVSFINGQELRFKDAFSNLNKEMMNSGIYTQTNVDDLLSHNFDEVTVARDLQEIRFNFYPKGVELPTEEELCIEPIPTGADKYDHELKQFTIDHKNTKLSRALAVWQRIIVNSKGGKVIETIPFFEISYHCGYMPIPTDRKLTAVCNSEDDIKRFPDLIKYIPDPTPDKRIKGSESLSEAFHKLYEISRLKFGTLEEAGIPLSELYDVVMLTGVPIHEIFGHHFEEPIKLLNFGESGTFKYGQNIRNKDIVLMDDPKKEIAGFRVQGFTHVDAYGRKREPRIHIKDGKVVGFLGSEYADPDKFKKYFNLEKSEFVGNAAQYADGYFPQPRMSCTVIDGPTENIDLEGKILLVPRGGYTIMQDKTYRLDAYECYVIRHNEPRRLVPLQVTGGINQALANMVLLDDLSYNTGFCEKPDPINPFVMARVPASQFVKSQMWEGQQVYSSPISNIHLKILTK